jgi:hypothetical protein
LYIPFPKQKSSFSIPAASRKCPYGFRVQRICRQPLAEFGLAALYQNSGFELVIPNGTK